MGADPRLGLAGGRDKLPHGVLTPAEQLQDLEPSRITENSKESSRRNCVGRKHEDGIHIWQAGYHKQLSGGLDVVGFPLEDNGSGNYR